MLRTLLAALAAAATLGLAQAAPMGGPGSAPEPDGLWTGGIFGYTPSTLTGAEVVDVDAVAALAKQGALLLDVAEPARKPDGLPANTVWRPQHRSIPGAVWFPGAAPGDLQPQRVEALKARVASLTGGDKAKAVVAFCYPDCWGSWNLGKRLVMWGYTNVKWFPRGVSAWQESDRPTAVVTADSEWSASGGQDH